MRFKARKVLLCVVPLLHVIVFALYIALQHEARSKNPEGHGMLPPGASELFTVPLQYRNGTKFHGKHQGVFRAAATKRSLKPVSVSSECSNLEYPEILSLREGWYPVDQLQSSYVFSAYYDERDGGIISIIGAKAVKGVPFICQFWKRSADGQKVTMTESKASPDSLPEGHGRKYTAVVFRCPVDENNVPETVSVVMKSCITPLNLLVVKDTRPEGKRRQFTVCVTPFNFRYGRAYELVEWLELNRILGADYFSFYNFSTAENVNRVLDYYSDLGLVEVVNWDLPVGVDTWPPTEQPVEIHYFGQLAFLNECWRRHRKQSEFVANIDLDEFIVPREPNVRTWTDLMVTLPKSPAYIFQNVFFRKEWNDSKLDFEGMENALKYKLVTLLKTVRESRIHPHNIRSKYMVLSDSAYTLGIHNIPSLRDGKHPYKVPASKALLHHYRNWENPNEKKARTKDMTMITMYKNAIIKSVKDIWSKLPGVELDIPVT